MKNYGETIIETINTRTNNVCDLVAHVFDELSKKIKALEHEIEQLKPHTDPFQIEMESLVHEDEVQQVTQKMADGRMKVLIKPEGRAPANAPLKGEHEISERSQLVYKNAWDRIKNHPQAIVDIVYLRNKKFSNPQIRRIMDSNIVSHPEAAGFYITVLRRKGIIDVSGSKYVINHPNLKEIESTYII